MVKPAASAVSGDAVATAVISGITPEVQAVVPLDESGHIVGSKDVYFYLVANQVFVNSASNPAWDLWNGDASLLVRVLSIKFIPDIITAVTGVSVAWLLERTTSLGTGGTAQTAWLPDLSQTALDADITCRSKPSGGAAASTDLYPFTLTSEETSTTLLQIAANGGLELVPEPIRQAPAGNGHGILLRPSQGLRLTQVTATAAGNAAHLIAFTVE